MSFFYLRIGVAINIRIHQILEVTKDEEVVCKFTTLEDWFNTKFLLLEVFEWIEE